LTEGFFIRDSGIFARFLRPETEDKCPLVVIFHGLPGTELNLDLAYALREAGFAVLAPNYNGSWGSQGDYRVESIPGNIATVFDYVCDDEVASKWGIDADRIAVVGHSLGGWATLIAPKISQRIRGIVALDPMVDPLFGGHLADAEPALKEMIVPLRGVTAPQMVDGLRWAGKEWHPMDTIKELGQRFFMLLCATGPDAIPLEPAMALLSKVRAFNPAAEFWALNSDHGFTSCRPLMRQLVVDFIRKRL
jgi:pimeloyl-ACP methyl ester carboxylesterase